MAKAAKKSVRIKGSSRRKTAKGTAPLVVQPFELTRENYYSPERPHISNSMVSDFLKSQNYYHRKHILKSLIRKETPSMKVGRAVDGMVTGEGHNETLTATQEENANGLAEAIRSSEAFKEILDERPVFQLPVSMHLLVGEVPDCVPVCGLIDIYSLDSDAKKHYITDIKTSSAHACRDARSWYYHCKQFGYDRQLAAYRMMLASQNGINKDRIQCRHIVAFKVDEGLYKVKTFVFDKKLLDEAEKEFRDTVKAIKDCEKIESWEDVDYGWWDAQVIEGSPVSRLETFDDDDAHVDD